MNYTESIINIFFANNIKKSLKIGFTKITLCSHCAPIIDIIWVFFSEYLWFTNIHYSHYVNIIDYSVYYGVSDKYCILITIFPNVAKCIVHFLSENSRI